MFWDLIIPNLSLEHPKESPVTMNTRNDPVFRDWLLLLVAVQFGNDPLLELLVLEPLGQYPTFAEYDSKVCIIADGLGSDLFQQRHCGIVAPFIRNHQRCNRLAPLLILTDIRRRHGCLRFRSVGSDAHGDTFLCTSDSDSGMIRGVNVRAFWIGDFGLGIRSRLRGNRMARLAVREPASRGSFRRRSLSYGGQGNGRETEEGVSLVAGPVMAGCAPRGLRAPFEALYTFLRNEPILFSGICLCIRRFLRHLCCLQTDLQLGSFWKNEPSFWGILMPQDREFGASQKRRYKSGARHSLDWANGRPANSVRHGSCGDGRHWFVTVMSPDCGRTFSRRCASLRACHGQRRYAKPTCNAGNSSPRFARCWPRRFHVMVCRRRLPIRNGCSNSPTICHCFCLDCSIPSCARCADCVRPANWSACNASCAPAR